VIAKQPQTPEAGIVSRSIIQRYATRQSTRIDSPAPSTARTTAVVYLVGTPDLPADDGQANPAVMDQKNETFIPHVLPIVAGTAVRFLNSDKVYHNVFSLSPTRSFDLGRYPKGQYRDVVFDKPGVVSVYCDIHTYMNAFILVLPNPYYATTDRDGRFRIRGVPPGTYEIRAWFGRWPEKSQKVVVREAGAVEVDFVFP
jgi:plastocyanin